MGDPARHPSAAATSHTPGPARSALPSVTRSGTGAGGAASASAVPGPVDATTLPPGPLDPARYATVVARNRYLAGKYDPSSMIDQTENLVTGAMSDPGRVLTPDEQAEHWALSEAIRHTLVPAPTTDEARLDAMETSPLGTIASLGVSVAGGSQASQDLALGLGAAAEGVGLSVAGARAGPATAFLGAQTGESAHPIDKAQIIDVAGEATNPVYAEAYKDDLRADMDKPHVSDPKLRLIIDFLYRETATAGSGSTAAALRCERFTGEPVGGREHSLKVPQSIKALGDWLRNNPTASRDDRAAAENVLIDLQNAMSGM